MQATPETCERRYTYLSPFQTLPITLIPLAAQSGRCRMTCVSYRTFSPYLHFYHFHPLPLLFFSIIPESIEKRTFFDPPIIPKSHLLSACQVPLLVLYAFSMQQALGIPELITGHGDLRFRAFTSSGTQGGRFLFRAYLSPYIPNYGYGAEYRRYKVNIAPRYRLVYSRLALFFGLLSCLTCNLTEAAI